MRQNKQKQVDGVAEKISKLVTDSLRHEVKFMDWVNMALDLEAKRSWSAAAAAWDAAGTFARFGAVKTGCANRAKWARTRTQIEDRKDLLVRGAEFQHEQEGAIVATCCYKGPRRFVYRSKTYSSISAAAAAAAEDLGMKSLGLNGWVFWKPIGENIHGR